MQDSQAFKVIIEDACKQDDSLWHEGKLNESLFVDRINNLDKSLLNLLSQSDKIRSKFFKSINDQTDIFDKDSFLLFWQENKLFNSYTKFLNKIGLKSKNTSRFISTNSDVILNFPFKDCVLQGSQIKEDAKQKEIFYHEVVAQDEIDRLFEEKALDNFKQISGTSDVIDQIPPPVQLSPAS